VGRAGRRLGLAAAVAALAIVAVALHGTLGTPAHSGGQHRRAAVAVALAGATGPPVAIGAHPIGVSIEYPVLARELGGGPCPPAALARTLTELGSPTLRIGGDSQDETAPAGTPPHPGVSDLAPLFWTRLACLERETALPVVVGLNLASGEPGWARALATDARAAIPAALLSFELGNEPDIYGNPVKWWNGHALVGAAMPWPTYVSRATALEAAIGRGSSIEGPDFASGRWVARVPALARTLQLRTIDAHFYPLDGCRDGAAATSEALLSRQTQTKLDERVRLARDARAAGLTAVISEANSISCGGVAGVSDKPPAAVWAVRMVLSALRSGFASVRFHSSGGAYDAFVVTGAAVVERPLYRALRAAAGLLVPGAVLRAIPSASTLDAVAITAPGGVRTIVVSNYSATARSVTLGATARARVLRIRAQAPAVSDAVVAPRRGRLAVELPPDSVDAITLAPAG
jgi:hypothetical protein